MPEITNIANASLRLLMENPKEGKSEGDFIQQIAGNSISKAVKMEKLKITTKQDKQLM